MDRGSDRDELRNRRVPLPPGTLRGANGKSYGGRAFRSSLTRARSRLPRGLVAARLAPSRLAPPRGGVAVLPESGSARAFERRSPAQPCVRLRGSWENGGGRSGDGALPPTITLIPLRSMRVPASGTALPRCRAAPRHEVPSRASEAIRRRASRSCAFRRALLRWDRGSSAGARLRRGG